jgi:hypothetical protein
MVINRGLSAKLDVVSMLNAKISRTHLQHLEFTICGGKNSKDTDKRCKRYNSKDTNNSQNLSSGANPL